MTRTPTREEFLEDLEWVLPARPSGPELVDAMRMSMPTIHRRLQRYAAAEAAEAQRLADRAAASKSPRKQARLRREAAAATRVREHLLLLDRMIVATDESHRAPLKRAA